MKINLVLFAASAALLLASACSPQMNTLSGTEKKAGWQLLFDGKTTGGWHTYGQAAVRGWAVENGELIALGQAGHEGTANDIVTERTFENFELVLEWKMSPGGNSGVFFNVVEDPAKYPAVYATGPEYQLVDDIGFPEKLEDWQKSAANYGMHAPARAVLKPVGQFNLTRMVVNKGHVEHWLNGVKVVAYQLWTPEWEALVRKGKWKDFPGYGRARSGRIALQDHGNQIWFRNIKIREL
ncbi:MAG: DUF1080 domain-containing protein [Saprospirales bacterium]|nr:DUF1080 domain-containing protein [Saprospirales bacterium]MBK8923484.1 DUF1080 domain-containing protein [Saprospirales bacterium]